MKTLLILGAGGHGKVVAEAAMASGRYRAIRLLDDRHPQLQSAAGFPVVGRLQELEAFKTTEHEALVCIGDNELRLRLIRRCQNAGYGIPTVVHPSATVSPSARLGAGTVVLAQAAVNAEARLGTGVIVNTSASVDHDCVLADGVHVSPGANLGGGVDVGAAAWIGIGAAVRQGIKIAAGATVGAGACVVADVAPGITVVGVPARPWKEA